MIQKLKFNLPITLMHTFVYQANKLPCMPTIEEEGFFEVNVQLIDLLPTRERDICQDWFKHRLVDDWEETPVSNPTGQTFRHRNQHTHTPCDDSGIDCLRHDETLTSGSNEIYHWESTWNFVIEIPQKCALSASRQGNKKLE